MVKFAAMVTLADKVSIKCSVSEEPEVHLTMNSVKYNITFNHEVFKLTPIYFMKTFHHFMYAPVSHFLTQTSTYLTNGISNCTFSLFHLSCPGLFFLLYNFFWHTRLLSTSFLTRPLPYLFYPSLVLRCAPFSFFPCCSLIPV